MWRACGALRTGALALARPPGTRACGGGGDISYTQGQAPEPRTREYFYYVDHQGQVGLERGLRGRTCKRGGAGGRAPVRGGISEVSKRDCRAGSTSWRDWGVASQPQRGRTPSSQPATRSCSCVSRAPHSQILPLPAVPGPGPPRLICKPWHIREEASRGASAEEVLHLIRNLRKGEVRGKHGSSGTRMARSAG